MRILFVNHTFPPESYAGSELCVLNLAKTLQQQDCQAAVFYRYSNVEADEFLVLRGEHEGIPTYKINNTFRFIRRFQDIYLNPVIAAKFAFILHEFKPDVVHFHHLTNLSLSLVQEAKAFGSVVVITLHDYWLLCQRGQLLKQDLELCQGPSDHACRSCLSAQLLRGQGQRIVSRLQKRYGHHPSERGKDVDLLDLSQAQVQTSNREFVAITNFDLGEAPQTVLMAHPPSELHFPLTSREPARLHTALALHPEMYDQPGGGVRFEILLGGKTIFCKDLNPKMDSQDRGWYPVQIDLSASRSNEPLILRTTALAGEDNQFCTAGWREPYIVFHTSQRKEVSQAKERIKRSPILARAARIAANAIAACSPTAKEGILHRKSWVRRVMQQADLFISPSEFLRDFFIRHGWPAGKIIFSDNGFIYPAEIAPRAVNAPLRFGYIGTWIPSKGVDLALMAFRDLDPQQAQLHVYGFFPGYDGFENYEEHLRSLAGPAVEFHGKYDPENVYEILARLDCLIMPSIWWENSPMTLHEAFLARVPVITADIGGMAEQVKMGGGLKFRHRDDESLREQVLRIVNEPKLLNDLRSTIPSIKSAQEHANEMLGIYKRLLIQQAGKHLAAHIG